MKFKNLLAASLLIATGATAQITIQGSALNSWTPADTIVDLTNVSASATVNGNWDLTTATYGTSFFSLTDQAATHPSFPSAAYSRAISYAINSSVGGYMSTIYWGKDNAGVYAYGEVLPRQAISIASVTMNNLDSIVFPAQTIMYSAPEKPMAFPMTYGSNWSSTSLFTTNFEMTVTAYSIISAPCQRRTRYEVRDTVKGWGKMRLKDMYSATSGYMDVLAVQEREYAIDSFYMGGAPAQPQILMAFGLSQGQVSSKFTTKFYRSGEVTPLLSLYHTDSTFTTTTGNVAMANRLDPAVNGIGDVTGGNNYNIYPNPVTNGVLHIEGIEKGNVWSYALTSLNGQLLTQGTLDAGNATLRIGDAVAGVYTLTLFKDGVSQGGQFVIVR